MSVFLIDIDAPRNDFDRESVVQDSLAKLGLLKNQIKNSQLIVNIAEEEVKNGIQKISENLFLSRQSHEADLIWIVSELKRVLSHWGDDEYRISVCKDGVQNLVAAIDKKTREV